MITAAIIVYILKVRMIGTVDNTSQNIWRNIEFEYIENLEFALPWY